MPTFHPTFQQYYSRYHDGKTVVLCFCQRLYLLGRHCKGDSYDEGIKPSFKQLVRNTDSSRMFHWGQWVLNHILDVQVYPYLVKGYSKIVLLRICEHDKLHSRRSLVVVELVFASPVGEEAVKSQSWLAMGMRGQLQLVCAPIVLSSQLLHHIPEREYQAEY